MDAFKFRCLKPNFESERSNDDNFPTATSLEQGCVEDSVGQMYTAFKNRLELDSDLLDELVLDRKMHVAFLKKGLIHLSQSYECLDASRPWLCYWILHSLDLLDEPLTDGDISEISNFLANCQCPDGGFGGGPGQVAHLAPTYAAVNALCILGTEEAYKVINRDKLYSYLLRMRTLEGAFKMHDGGEVDIRGAYCAASVARLTNIMTPALFDGTPEWIVMCQTYEGGFGGCPGMEAHGGYSFCGLAALILLEHAKLCNIQALQRWTVNKQMSYEGGFQGRSNKLVDGCYSFWQGGAFPLIHMVLAMEVDKALSAERWLFNQEALQEYILICCQAPGGGLLDKPGKTRDFYHTCYCLSGLSVAQHFAGGKIGDTFVVGHQKNLLKPTHPVFNIGVDASVHATLYFSALPVPGTSQ
ncbi:hypothetical protein CHS0354_021606 [Potamilus streckersoni]|uniref:Protein farnesyltransferase subunit beta n=1 Tax=Potamilus streckersoni TaxID=2493646 RepID=A0AAE0SNT1_9BIVA|nr:hypothetical protein CHS0354_021606 [Potamilus streckersoni]